MPGSERSAQSQRQCGGERGPDRPGRGEVAKSKLTLAELDEEEQSLDRLRRWYRTIKSRDLYGAPSAAAADRRLKERAEALEDFAEQVYQARERP